MIEEKFKIWVDRLTEGRVQKIEDSLSPEFLGIDEENLKFASPVTVKGEAYLADQHLVVRLQATTWASIPCSICNRFIETELRVDDFYHTEPLSEIHGALFDFSNPLRESLLIELPHYFECANGNCPERASIASYLRGSGESQKPGPEGSNNHFPFAGL